jgi:looped-hinge helix DNA binding domain, AbrB family
MSLPPSVVSAPFHVGAKGRVVLPAAVRRAARIAEGDQVVARPEGEGRVVIETVRSIRERVWGAAPDPSGLDSTTEVRAMRAEDNNVSDQAFARRSAAGGTEADRTEGESAAAGAALLARLGL